MFHPCGSRMMGGKSNFDPTRDDLTVVTERVLAKAGFEVVYPKGLSGMCCGLAFHSKGVRVNHFWHPPPRKSPASLQSPNNLAEQALQASIALCSSKKKKAWTLKGKHASQFRK